MAAYLRSQVNHERIKVHHFHEWAKSILGGLPHPKNYENEDEYDEEVGDRLFAALEKIPVEEKWDAVLVDEGHTFQPNWVRLAEAQICDDNYEIPETDLIDELQTLESSKKQNLGLDSCK